MSGRIDEVNRRVMGDSALAVEVLGDPDDVLVHCPGRQPGEPGRAERPGL